LCRAELCDQRELREKLEAATMEEIAVSVMA
jgi:hypothetical protein